MWSRRPPTGRQFEAPVGTSIRQFNLSPRSPLHEELQAPEASPPEREPWSDVLRRYAVDEVVAVTAWNQAAIWNELAEACADRGVIFRQLVVMPKPRIGKYHIEEAGNGQYFVSLETVPQDFLALAVKRALDLLGGILGVMLCAMVFPFYALWLRIASP